MSQTHELLGHSDRNSALKQLPELRSTVKVPAEANNKFASYRRQVRNTLTLSVPGRSLGRFAQAQNVQGISEFACTHAQDGKTYIPVSACML